MNASLAIQLAHAWMRMSEKQYIVNRKFDIEHKCYKEVNELTSIKYRNGYKFREPDKVDIVKDIPLSTLLALRNCKWPGRYQFIKSNYAQFYLDGAHTKESMEICCRWFLQHNR